ncbi:hypothetical protein L0337_35090 [candidate division KSB1 bacterium]|nr:hypothetical protein [candidate division KSB1 bacterium]
MITQQQFSLKPKTVPASTSWYLADLSEARGKQESFTRQTPQRLKVLREHALIESAVSSNRKERYYETLEQSSQRWHDGRHDPWPYLNYVLFILKSAYREFEERLGQIKSPRGTKTEIITNAIERTGRPFRISDIQRECPGVSVDIIRRVLKTLRAAGQVKCLGRGQNAHWQKTARGK